MKSQIYRRGLILATSSALYLALSPSAMAEKMDIKTQGYVIDKLEKVLSKDNAPSRHALELRLGDLYSEQARLVGLEEAEGRCPTKDCKLSQSHRAKALDYYQKGLKGASPTQAARAQIQMAHLHKSLGQDRQAISIYKGIIRDGSRSYDRETIGLAHSSLGEIHYQKQNYKSAVFQFNKAYDIKETPNRGQALYRIAWCRFNLGAVKTSTRLMEHLAKTPELLTRNTTAGEKYDVAFHEEVSRDLATFYARNHIGDNEVQNIIRLSPGHAVKDNLIFLASEADRLGQKRASLHIWGALVQRSDLSTYERIEAQARVAQIHYDLGSKTKALAEYDNAAKLWRKLGCKDKDQCQILQIRMKNFVTEWNKKELNELSKELLAAYDVYIALFRDDLDMQYWAAGIAFDLKRWNDAARLYRLSSVTAYNQLKAGTAKDKAGANKIFDGALLAEIDVAERAGSLELKAKAYDHYLNLNPQGGKHMDVRYQRAQVEYDRKNYPGAAEAFRRVALFDTKDQEELKKTAANLSLDALAFTKDDLKIDSWSLEFAKVFPKSANDFYKVSRRARLNKSEKIANNKSSSASQLRAATELLKTAPLAGASKEEKIAIFRNRLVVAERLQDIDETLVAATALYALPGLSERDNEFALSRKAWAAEMKLDFKGAYYLFAKTSLKGLKPEDKALKLATLAELGGVSASTGHYQEFIEKTSSRLKANHIRAKLVLNSSRPDRLLREYEADLLRTPEVMGTLAYELFVKDQNYKRAEAMLQNKQVRNTADGRSLGRFVAIKHIQSLDRKISRQRLRASSDALLQKSLSQRLALLGEADAIANEAINAKDWTLQILTLSIVKEQNERLYRELAELPVPTGLSAEQRRAYLSALKAQATPYKTKSQQVADTLDELWGRSANFKSLAQDFEKSSFQEKQIVRIEAAALAQKAGGRAQRYLYNITKAETKAPRHEAIVAARNQVRANPFDLRAIRELRDLERELGRGTMVAYLEERMALTKAGG